MVVRRQLRLAFVIPSLGCGGAERVAVTLGAEFVNRGHHLTVLTTTSRPDFFELDERIDRISLDLTKAAPGSATSRSQILRTVARFPAGLKSLRDALTQARPDVIVSFMDQANVLTLACKPSAPIVITEHTDPNQHALGSGWRLTRRALYPTASHLVSASNGVDASFLWIDSSRRTVIANPVAVPTALPDTEPGRLVTLGRLIPSKQFDHLLRAFRTALTSAPGWHLDLVGDGTDRDRLQRLVEDLALTESVTFAGAAADPVPYLARAELFALTSRYEGFGNVLIEALATGTPVVSYDCHSGPAEIIEHGHNGHLVPPQDERQLADTLTTLMSDAAKRSALALNAAASVEKYHVTSIASRWEELLLSVAPASSQASAA